MEKHNYIKNPENNSYVSINSKAGKEVILKYAVKAGLLDYNSFQKGEENISSQLQEIPALAPEPAQNSEQVLEPAQAQAPPQEQNNII
tara:strand:+ start:37 stop:300 length:264 start_codon:yes stop_codon:yes gene_type:complete